MKKNFFEWVAFVFLFVWQLPQNIIGAVMWLYFKLFGGIKLIDQTKWSFAFEGARMQGGISLGTFCFVSVISAKRKEVIAHELRGHTVDSRWMGPFYLLIIGLPSILNAMFDFTTCYYDFFTERMANAHAGLEVDSLCRLRFKKTETKQAVEVKVMATQKPEPEVKQKTEEPKNEDDLTERINAISRRIDQLKSK